MGQLVVACDGLRAIGFMQPAVSVGQQPNGGTLRKSLCCVLRIAVLNSCNSVIYYCLFILLDMVPFEHDTKSDSTSYNSST